MPESRAQPTIRREFERATATLAAAGVPEPRREARWLMRAASLSAAHPWLEADRRMGAVLARRYRSAVSRRARGLPSAYAAGYQAFRTLEVACDPRALIPRPETEGLVELVLRWASRRWDAEPWGVVADIGTGTGCIALSLAWEGRFTRVIAVERSPAAAALARANVNRLGSPVPVEIREGDLVEPLAGVRVDVVVSNPPYLSAAEYATLDSGVRDHEPADALVGGADGLGVTTRLLAGARQVLRPAGLLALEVDCRRARRVADRARAAGWRGVRVCDDLFGRPRYLLAELGGES